MEENTSVITYLLFMVIIMLTWQSFAGSTFYFILMTFFVLPLLGGIFRI
jgi:hypothetical protein